MGDYLAHILKKRFKIHFIDLAKCSHSAVEASRERSGWRSEHATEAIFVLGNCQFEPFDFRAVRYRFLMPSLRTLRNSLINQKKLAQDIANCNTDIELSWTSFSNYKRAAAKPNGGWQTGAAQLSATGLWPPQLGHLFLAG